MCVEMIETKSLKISLKSFHENYSDLLKKQRGTKFFYLDAHFLNVAHSVPGDKI